MKTIPQVIIIIENEMKPVLRLRLWNSTRYPAMVVDNAADVPSISMSIENTLPLTSSSTQDCVNTVESTQFPPLAECEMIINPTVSGR